MSSTDRALIAALTHCLRSADASDALRPSGARCDGDGCSRAPSPVLRDGSASCWPTCARCGDGHPWQPEELVTADPASGFDDASAVAKTGGCRSGSTLAAGADVITINAWPGEQREELPCRSSPSTRHVDTVFRRRLYLLAVIEARPPRVHTAGIRPPAPRRLAQSAGRATPYRCRAYDHRYNNHRPQRALGQAVQLRRTPQHTTSEPNGIRRRDRLGGLLHEYQQVA